MGNQQYKHITLSMSTNMFGGKITITDSKGTRTLQKGVIHSKEFQKIINEYQENGWRLLNTDSGNVNALGYGVINAHFEKVEDARIKCPFCSESILTDARFCQFCGKRIQD